ncbi:hypothetical protein C8R44DRAFT_785404 [Mycena epipterygia]|nr:hypothetical protein C8R44DRAFT_785404 [Mycena epipterygia]
MDQRFAIYSDRPSMVMANLSGYGQPFVLRPYGENWHQQRKIAAQDLARAQSPGTTRSRKRRPGSSSAVYSMIQAPFTAKLNCD